MRLGSVKVIVIGLTWSLSEPPLTRFTSLALTSSSFLMCTVAANFCLIYGQEKNTKRCFDKGKIITSKHKSSRTKRQRVRKIAYALHVMRTRRGPVTYLVHERRHLECVWPCRIRLRRRRWCCRRVGGGRRLVIAARLWRERRPLPVWTKSKDDDDWQSSLGRVRRTESLLGEQWRRRHLVTDRRLVVWYQKWPQRRAAFVSRALCVVVRVRIITQTRPGRLLVEGKRPITDANYKSCCCCCCCRLLHVAAMIQQITLVDVFLW